MDQNQDLQYQIAALALGEYGVDLRKPARPPALAQLDNARFLDERTAIRRDGYVGRQIVDGAPFPPFGAVVAAGAWLYGHGLVATGASPGLVPTISDVAPSGSVNTSTTLTWDVQIAVDGLAQTSISARLTVTYPAGGRPATAPTIVTTPPGWVAGAWDNSIANTWVCTVTAASEAIGDSVFALSSNTGTVAGTLVLGIDTLHSAETTNAGNGDASTSSNVTVNAAASWTTDATSGVAIPQSTTEWTAFNTAHSLTATPFLLCKCQEASGNLADSIGGLTLTVTGTPGYQQTVTGWSSKAITFVDGGATAISTSDASLPDVSTTSMLTIAYINASSDPSAQRYLLLHGSTNNASNARTLEGANGVLSAISAGNTANGSTSIVGAGVSGVIPLTLQNDHTNSVALAATAADKMMPTFAALASGKLLSIGRSGGCAPQGTLYFVSFKGSSAEMTAATLKSLLQGLGFTIGWT